MARTSTPISDSSRQIVGQEAIRRDLKLAVPAPMVESYVAKTSRRTEIIGSRTVETYPQHYEPGDAFLDQLRFALRYEPLDLRILSAAFAAQGADPIVQWINDEPTGAYARRAWFLYETLTGQTLAIDAASSGNYVDALDHRKQFVSARHPSRRHRVNDNLLGGPGMTVTVRRTCALEVSTISGLDRKAAALVHRFEEPVLARAASYLYTKETRSSFFIEGETPSQSREERFIDALRTVLDFDPGDRESCIQRQ
jgi:hypothetical protein